VSRPIRVVPWLLLLALLQPGAGAQADAWAVPPALVTAAVVEAKIDEVESDPQLDGEARAKLVALYRRSLTNLEQINRTLAQAVGFQEEARTAPEQTREIRARIAETDAVAPLDPNGAADLSLHDLELELQLARAGRDTEAARRGSLARQLIYLENRPVTIRQRLAEADEEQRAIAASLQGELAGETRSALPQARHWSLETRYVALSKEIMALDQELAGLPMQLDLIAARRDEAAANLTRIEGRIEALQAQVNERRRDEARQAVDASERRLQTSAGQDPALVRIAERDADLAARLSAAVAEDDRLDAEQQAAERLAARIRANFERVQTARDIGVSREGLGQLLLEHRAALPDFKRYERRATALERQIAAVNLSRLRHLEEAERLAAESPRGPTGAGIPPADARLHDLTAERRGLLDRLVEAEARYLERLRKLAASQGEMLNAARAYDKFLSEHLFWLPTGARTQLGDLARLPDEVRLVLAPKHWSELAGLLTTEVAPSPLLWLVLLLSAALLWKRRALIALLRGTAPPLRHPATDRFHYTLRALLLTLVLAAAWPVVLGVAGWRLMATTPETELSLFLGAGLVRLGLWLFILLALRASCLPGGLAIAHFQWPEPEVRRLGAELRWLIWVLIPAILLGHAAMTLNPIAAGGLLMQLGLAVATLALGLFFYRVLHPRRGLLRRQQRRADAGLIYRTQPLWFPLLLGFPFALMVLSWNGYVYTKLILTDAFVFTLWLVVALILLHAMALRWLRLTHRHLAFQAAQERRRAALAAREAKALPVGEAVDLAPVEEAELDLDAASQDSRRLLRNAVALAAALGLYLVWSAVFPAMGILDDVILWHTKTTIDGKEGSLPISLADLGLAAIYLGVALVLAKRLPALLDMILAQRLAVASGNRYTITALTSYVIFAVGVLLALSTIGAQWTQLQWLVAALGVGIGFGLQEIVANFISGLIILFERPIRVGDIVTVGDTDGTVTKIRIRATTIRNWDRKELLVPNKEFITGRLLNWSLSDHVTRLMITVGVAYGSDVERAHALMREAAEEHPRVLRDLPPMLTFEAFGDNSLTLTLRAYIDDLNYRLATITDLHKAINHKFQQAGITIAYPQRDLHLDTHGPLRVRIEDATRPQSGAGDTGSAGA